MKITGAVLEEVGRSGPYAETAPITVSELELAPPGTGELLVRMEAAGVCHSDLSVVDGNRPRPVPMLLGHEAAGVVEAVGDGVGDVSVGTRVIMTFLPRCGECAGCRSRGQLPCSPGTAANNAGELLGGGGRLQRGTERVHHHMGVSGFATYAVVDRRSVVPVASDVPPIVASLMGCAVLTGGGALLNAARPEPGQQVLVVGLGGVGMAALLTALGMDEVTVVGVDAQPHKLELARELGAADVLTPEQALEQGVTGDVVIEAVGHARAFEAAVAATAVGGTTVTVGLPSPSASAQISPLGLVAEARTIRGSYLGSAVPERDIPLFVDMWRAGKLPVERLVSDTIGLGQINQAMDHLANGRAIRQIIDFGSTTTNP